MRFGFRKRLKIAPGVSLNLTHRSAGMTVGGKYARVSANTRNGTTVSASAPGTGLYATHKISSRKPEQRFVRAVPPLEAVEKAPNKRLGQFIGWCCIMVIVLILLSRLAS